jgi:hypothetical protein
MGKFSRFPQAAQTFWVIEKTPFSYICQIFFQATKNVLVHNSVDWLLG